MNGFTKRTVTIPDELEGFVEERRGSSEFAGNLSAYVRSLILKDRASRQLLPRSARLSVKRPSQKATKVTK